MLRALYYQAKPVGLRSLARLAEVHPHSAERMLKELVKEGVVRRSITGSRAMYRKNTAHHDWYTLKAVFTAADESVRKVRAGQLNERAKNLLPFMEEAHAMLKEARGSQHVA